MKKLLFIIVLFCSLSACKHQERIEFRGVASDDIAGTDGLYNPDRGLRLEVAIDVIKDRDNPTQGLKKLVELYKSDSISLVQTYIYLTNVVGQDLTEENFAVMQSVFNEIENLGMKSVLRFAYERDFNGRVAVGPTLQQALDHLDQLKPFLEKNKHLIHVMQAGVIGAWGEWHSSVHGLDQSDEAKIAILKKLLEVVPEELAIQIRVPEYKNLLKDSPELYKRLSFHDDMIIIQPHRWDGGMHEGTAFFDQIVEETVTLPMDGELPWGFWSINEDPDSPDAGWLIDGHQAARRFFLQHFTSLSAIHNYLEPKGRQGKEDEIKYSMQVWKETPIDLEFLKKEGMPISDNYFETKSGKPTDRTVFDYIRDHLGYRIELQSLDIDKEWKTGSNSLKITLVNRGFASVFNQHDVYFVLIGEHGEVIESKTLANVFDWQPYIKDQETRKTQEHIVNHDFILPNDIQEGHYKLGLWIPDGSEQLKYNPRYAIRCANGDIEWHRSVDGKYGVNILTAIDVK